MSHVKVVFETEGVDGVGKGIAFNDDGAVGGADEVIGAEGFARAMVTVATTLGVCSPVRATAADC